MVTGRRPSPRRVHTAPAEYTHVTHSGFSASVVSSTGMRKAVAWSSLRMITTSAHPSVCVGSYNSNPTTCFGEGRTVLRR